MKKILGIVSVVAAALCANAALVNHLKFDDPEHLLQAAVGSDGIAYASSNNNTAVSLAGVGGLSASTDPLSPVRGGGAIKLPMRNFLAVPQGVGTTENKPWCMVMKFFSKPEHSANFTCLYSLNMANNADGWLFMKNGLYGFSSGPGGWSTNYQDLLGIGAALYGSWHTLILSVPADTGKPALYLDGRKYADSTVAYWLTGKDYIYIGADNNGEDGTIYVDEVKVFDETCPEEYFKDGVIRTASTAESFAEADVVSSVKPERTVVADGVTQFTLHSDAVVTTKDRNRLLIVRKCDASGEVFDSRVVVFQEPGSLPISIDDADRIIVEVTSAVDPVACAAAVEVNPTDAMISVYDIFLGVGQVTGSLHVSVVKKGESPDYTFVRNLTPGISTAAYKAENLESGCEYDCFVKVINGSSTEFEVLACSFSTMNAVYVDALAAPGGDGSQTAPFQTIGEGVAAAVAGDRVLVKGGADRLYQMNEDADQIAVPEEKPGLVIASWGDDTVLFKVSDTYSQDAGLAKQGGVIVPPFMISADSVVLRNISVEIGKNSLGKANYPGAPILNCTADGLLLENCSFRQTAEGDRYSSCNAYPSGFFQFAGAGTVVRNCTFDTLMSNVSAFQHPLARVGRDGVLFEGCFFTNITRVVEALVNNTKIPVTVVSNRFVNCPSYTACSESGDANSGLFCGAYTGIGLLDCSYNVFRNDETLAGKSKTVCQSCRGTFTDGFVFHHNTVVGFENILCRSRLEGDIPLEVFDNIFVMADENSLIFNERRTYGKTGVESATDKPSGFKKGSHFRNNFVDCTVNGGTLTEYAGYDFAGYVTVSDNVSTPGPVFMSLDPASPNFCRLKTSANPELTGKRVAWTGDDGEYSNYIGAVEPLRGMSGSAIYIY